MTAIPVPLTYDIALQRLALLSELAASILDKDPTDNKLPLELLQKTIPFVLKTVLDINENTEMTQTHALKSTEQLVVESLGFYLNKETKTDEDIIAMLGLSVIHIYVFTGDTRILTTLTK